jgi:hypothetical protein
MLMLFVTRVWLLRCRYERAGAPAACGRRCRRVNEVAMIHKPWKATSMLIAAPTAPLSLAVTVNSRLGPGLGRGGRRPRRCSRNAFRVHPPGPPADPRGALSALSLDAAKITVNAAAHGTRFR